MQIKHTGATSSIGAQVVKHGEYCELKIHLESVIEDIDRLTNEAKSAYNDNDKANIKNLVSYLTKLKKHVGKEEAKLEITWHQGNDGLPSVYPLQFISYPVYGVETVNYIEVSGDEHIVNMDLSEMANLVAYEFIHRELGETHESIEKLLDESSLISANSTDVLNNKFSLENKGMYDLSKQLLIGNCIMFSVDDKTVYDYFHTRGFKCTNKTSYKDVVDYSCKYICTLIADHLIKKCKGLGVECKTLEISPNSLTFKVDKTKKPELDIKNQVIEDIDIQVFGRMFRLNIPVNIY